jgi:hypothetical protein
MITCSASNSGNPGSVLNLKTRYPGRDFSQSLQTITVAEIPT